MNNIQGKKVDKLPHELNPGEYTKFDDRWWAACPCQKNQYGFIVLANLKKHTVIENEDGTITVSPSILVSDMQNKSLWHGFLEQGMWREC